MNALEETWNGALNSKVNIATKSSPARLFCEQSTKLSSFKVQNKKKMFHK